jgi:hypothetical protein
VRGKGYPNIPYLKMYSNQFLYWQPSTSRLLAGKSITD